MKHTIAILILLLSGQVLMAQYCGNSGPQVCNTTYYPIEPGSSSGKKLDSLPCIIRGVNYSESITLRTDSAFINYAGQLVQISVYSYQIDSICNLPQGLCWATNKSDNKVTNGGWMCINVTGQTNVPAGLYPVKLWYKSHVSVPQTADYTPNTHYLKVSDTGADCAAITAIKEQTPVTATIRIEESNLLIQGGNEDYVIVICDAVGRVLYRGTVLASTQTKIDLSNIHGLFFASVQNAIGHTAKKFFRE